MLSAFALARTCRTFSVPSSSAHHFEEDDANSSDYLFMAAYFADRVVKDQKQAIELFKELKEKYPKTEKGFEADKYLAQLGVYK
jgi:hypothetical protein